ncbi:hypothetical protein [Flavobacterium sp. AED]|uniref:hypothetical protein n=1 Tax=Flavobacterium sp. AED TaxID=1423323 RepID=UPI0005803605|nr:hypothetical protein [Flavobacterium sp. AED]KIA86585.1 hypothetical protein OA85_02745 [Flavobacterium sp. AED]
MKNITRIFCCLFVLITIVSCGSGKPIVLQNETTKTIIETVHDTIFKIEKDNSSLEALLECQNGKVVIKQIVQGEPGRTLNSPKVRIADNLLKVDCEVRAQELLAHYKNTHEANTIIKTLPPIEINRITNWQKAQINLFRIYAVLTLLFGAWVFIKSKL